MILGDSMLKYINQRKMQQGVNGKVKVKTFPGACVEDMTHYIKPTLKRKPSHLILHVGTNDMQSKSPDEIVSTIKHIGEKIAEESNGTEFIVSEIITRNDDPQLTSKVNECNIKLDELCAGLNWGLIKHNNICKTHLNSYGLHLNQRGTGLLAGNLKSYLKNIILS